MEFEWDEAKRQETIVKRDVDILRAARMFEQDVFQFIDSRKDYGEIRYRAIGMVGEDCFVLVYTERGNVVRLITAWKGGQDERTQYQASLAQRDRGDGSSR